MPSKIPLNDDGEEIPAGPTEAEIEAWYQQELAIVFAELQAWANNRLHVGTLDSDIKKLIVRKIGTLSGSQMQVLQAQRTLIPFGVTPARFKELRTTEMFLTDAEYDRLGSPDLSDEAEMDMYRWALTDICDWLESQPDGKQHYQTLVVIYRKALQGAAQTYTEVHGPPIAVKTINVVMTIARAKKFLKGDFS